MYFDPLYWLVLAVGFGGSMLASLWVKSTFAKYSQYATQSGLTGAEVAELILRRNGLHHVRVERVPGSLSDHYDPRSKTLRLSDDVYGSNSMAAFGVAAHEVGHALQDAQGSAMLQLRSAWVPVANFSSGLSMIVIIIAFVLGGAATALGTAAAWLGIALFGCTTIFTLVTLPVEFDASYRALKTLEQENLMDRQELAGARAVLRAAAMTYVAAFVSSLLMLLYYAYRLGLIGGRRD